MIVDGSKAVKGHACWTEQDANRQAELHGKLHNQRYPDYIHFVHIPKGP